MHTVALTHDDRQRGKMVFKSIWRERVKRGHMPQSLSVTRQIPCDRPIWPAPKPRIVSNRNVFKIKNRSCCSFCTRLPQPGNSRSALLPHHALPERECACRQMQAHGCHEVIFILNVSRNRRIFFRAAAASARRHPAGAAGEGLR